MMGKYGKVVYAGQTFGRTTPPFGQIAPLYPQQRICFAVPNLLHKMLSNFFLLAWRNILARKTIALINVFGLSIAIGTGITVFLFLKNYWSLDDFHRYGDRIFMVEYQTETDAVAQTWGDAPLEIAAPLATDFPQVEQVVRVSRESAALIYKDERIDELLTYADPGFFEVFSFPLRFGSPNALKDPNALIISDKLAEKYFKDENPVGKTLTLYNSSREQVTFTIQGVAAPFPNNAGFRFDLLAGYHTAHTALKNTTWKSRSDGVFVLLRNPGEAQAMAAQLQRFLPLFSAANPEEKITGFVLDNLQDPNPGAYEVLRRPTEAGHPAVTVIYGLIALLMMALSCFNYVNIALGAAARRLREIGVRKAIGGSRGQLVAQFMAENLLLCSFALLTGTVLAKYVLLPIQNQAMVIQAGGSWAQIASVWWFLAALLAFTAFVSGAYPAFYVSRFNTTAIFSGKQAFGDKSPLRRALLGLQFGLAHLAILLSVVLVVSGKQWQEKSWGYDPAQTLVISLSDSTQYAPLRNELLKLPQIEAVGGAVQHLGLGSNRRRLQVNGESREAACYEVGAQYEQAMELPLKAGRFFREGPGDAQVVVVSECFARQQDWQEAIGQTIRLDQQDYVVVGVAGDVKTVPTGVPQPVVYFSSLPGQYQFLLARFTPGTGPAVITAVKAAYQELFAGLPAQYFLQSEVFEGFDRSFRDSAREFGYVALMALLLACMGLYGLAAQHYAQRRKAVSIHKLLGAPVPRILLLINREFLLLLAIAGALATVIGFSAIALLIRQLKSYVGDFNPGVSPYLAAATLVLLAAAAAVARQSWATTRIALADTLRDGG